MINQDPQYYVQGVLEQNKRIISKTITLIESSLPAHQELARIVVDSILPYTGNAVRLGITGVPGVGKSTFIESLGMMLARDKTHPLKKGTKIRKTYKVAVLAVDPSSTRSGGSIMADKTRMEKLSAHERAFIRPSPSGGTLGGVARKTRETMLICEAGGFDVIIIETVGVGQSETTVASMVDFFLVLMLAGAGDELQGIKKGVLELADALTINKADGDNIEKARQARKEYETALHFLTPSSPTWSPPVLTCSARETVGIDTIWETVLEHREKLLNTGELEDRRRKQALDWMWSLVEEGLKERFYKNPDVKEMLPTLTREVEKGQTAATIAASRLLFLHDNHHSEKALK
ncbi:methylmalonyl Co-A mutase-associated GTPase MeaB [Desulfonema magnum]|uniref:LAO/AO transport system ATPase n=1 Tax=Desulfonema magnum TaxID=45655 RepID=A0A975BQ83_9BACT|nr:methylmalonyl Co-A mutase-associated GTPase MeaB [Desulfonema magnum]QTA89854.1 LAO/AO transport system ATPase [Desulfonema magnum]